MKEGVFYSAGLGLLWVTLWVGVRFLESSIFGHGNFLPWNHRLAEALRTAVIKNAKTSQRPPCRH